MTKLRITIVSAESMTDGYAPFAHSQGLKSAFEKLGHQISVVGRDDGPYHDAVFMTRLFRYLIVNWNAMMALRNSDLMIARSHFANLPWTIVARLISKPVIHEMNGMVFDAATTHQWLRSFQTVITASYRWQFRMATGIACITEQIAEHVRAFAPGSFVGVVKNGVDASVFFPGEASEKRNYAVFPSALTAWHGVNTLLDAVDHPAWPAGLDLYIAGDGAQTPLVMEKAEKNIKVRYLGLLPREQLAKVLREAEIGLCLVESLSGRGVMQVFPLKLFEMMASGLPIVATDLPGQRDIVIGAQAGVIAPLNDPVALAKAVAKLRKDPDRREMGRRAAETVSSQHSWHVRAIELERFIRRSLEQRTQRQSAEKS
jgi:glycosyltransferase involved in cell wall biosynthesis